ncbi:FAD binding domain-containing protein [Paenibacillus sp. NEAU-GSW1]|uniref:FAD binding domain-containing protein n=1 Tax=Paenibacillus sp. NEAU-GSW1 TaxID=2682486 RepID=UPI0012E1E974|nr:FAD binding domain-containing protein [Paenibacillus sp. NEAU-GSW1]MUT67067.1 hypothetical protein [Paenibacillus sp. NEAU-GSW1]
MAANLQGNPIISSVWHPKDAEEARRIKLQWGEQAVFTAGGTLLRTQWESGIADAPAHLIDLNSVDEMHELTEGQSGEWLIGAMTTLSKCRRHVMLQSKLPLIAEAMRSIAAPSIRNLATIGGNIASVVGDSLPALLVYDAILHWYDGQTTARQPLYEWLETAALHSGWKDRLLLRVELPKMSVAPESKPFAVYQKIGRREAFTPSVVTIALTGSLNADGRWKDIRIAAGGGQTVPRRLEAAEAELNDKAADAHSLSAVYNGILAAFEPKGDAFASADYRRKTAANIVVSELWSAAKRLADER